MIDRIADGRTDLVFDYLARVYQPEMEKLPRGRSWSGNERLQDV